EKPDREGRARSEAAARREVAIVMDLDAAIHAKESQDLADGRMADLVEGLAILHLGVDDAEPVFEERRQIAAGDVAELVDRGGQDRSAVLPIPGRVIGPAAEEGDPERRAADDHASPLSLAAASGDAVSRPTGRQEARDRPATA